VNRRTPVPFDAQALAKALEVKRLEKGLTWTGAASEIWELSFELNATRHDHPISASALRNVGMQNGTSCQHALFMLRWLERSPESFLTGAPLDAGFGLPPAGADRRLRWNLRTLFATLDTARRADGLTWKEMAAQIGCTPSQLTGLRKAKFATGMDVAMRIVQWLGRDSSFFIYAASW
jgi:hypothetical protein